MAVSSSTNRTDNNDTICNETICNDTKNAVQTDLLLILSASIHWNGYWIAFSQCVLHLFGTSFTRLDSFGGKVFSPIFFWSVPKRSEKVLWPFEHLEVRWWLLRLLNLRRRGTDWIYWLSITDWVLLIEWNMLVFQKRSSKYADPIRAESNVNFFMRVKVIHLSHPKVSSLKVRKPLSKANDRYLPFIR